MSPDPGGDPNGENPDGDDMAGGDSPGPPPEITREVLRTIPAIDDEETRTEVTIQKFAYSLGLKLDVPAFKLYSFYLFGPDSIPVKTALYELERRDLVRTRTSPHPRVDADVYALTDKGEEMLEEIGDASKYAEVYDNWFRNRYGQSGSWGEYDEFIYSWLTSEPNYVAVNTELLDGLRKRVAVADDFDPFFEDYLNAADPGFTNRFDGVNARFAKLAYYLAEEKKGPPDKGDGSLHDHKVRFSVRNIRDYWDDGPTDPEHKVVLIRGFAETVQHKDRIFYVKEDRLESSPSIRVEFYGEWGKPSDEILSKYSIGVLGYVTKSSGEITIKALAIIQANELPNALKSGRQASLTEFGKRSNSAAPSRAPTDDTSRPELRDERDSIIEDLGESEEEFLQDHNGEVSTEKGGDWADAIEDLVEDLTGEKLVDADKLREWVANNFDEPVDKMMKIDFLIELLRWLWRHIDVPF